MARRWRSKQKKKTKNIYLNKFAQYFGLKDKRSLGAGPFFQPLKVCLSNRNIGQISLNLYFFGLFFFLLLRCPAVRISLLFYTWIGELKSWNCTYNTLSSGTSLYRSYISPPEIRRRRIRETLHNVSTFSSGESLHVVMIMSGLQGMPWDRQQVSCWEVWVLNSAKVGTIVGTMLHASSKSTLHGHFWNAAYRKKHRRLHRRSDYSMARECRLLKNWTGLRVVPTWLTNFTIIIVSPRR